MTGRTVTRLSAAVLLATSLLSPMRPAAMQPPAANMVTLRDLGGLDDLRALFENDREKLRLVLLLSPT